jgi:hypothetical protein
VKTSFLKFALSSVALACACGSAVADNQYEELAAMAPLMIGPTYTATFSHVAGVSFSDTLAFNVPASLLQGAVVNLSTPNTTSFGWLTADLYMGVDPSSKTASPPASCMPGCAAEGYSLIGNIGGLASTWTSPLVPISSPGYYFLVIAGNTQSLNSVGGTYDASITLSPIPEASGWLMLMSGLGVVGLVSRRRLQRAA